MIDEYHIDDFSDLLHRQEWEGSEGWEEESDAEPIDRVRLLTEAVATYNAIDRRIKAMERMRVWDASVLSGVDSPRIRFIILQQTREKAWARYLRRWADAREDGYQGEWFDPWVPQKDK